MKRKTKEKLSKGIGFGVGFTIGAAGLIKLVSICGRAGLSAAGISTGLACLGFGSMIGGILVITAGATIATQVGEHLGHRLSKKF